METVDLQTQVLNVSGMTCINCQNRIERELKNIEGIIDASVSYKTGVAFVSFNKSVVTLKAIKAAIESLGYNVAEREEKKPDGKKGTLHGTGTLPRKMFKIAGTVVIIIALYLLFQAVSMSRLVTGFPVAKVGMGYGMVLLIGLVTSVHCIAMCGGINLSQSLGARKPPVNDSAKSEPPSSGITLLMPGILYNAGRLLSYTAVGVAVGALGSVITVSGRFQGALLLLAGVFMLIMGINMLGLFPGLRRITPHLPAKLQKGLASFFAEKIGRQGTGNGPLVVGFLNGFIPCGPLQAMQLYALSTGSPLRGGISMFLFCLGTIPLMFGLGAAGGILSGIKGQAFSRRVIQAGAILIAAMGLAMLSNGWNLAGLYNPFNKASSVIADSAKDESKVFVPEIRDGAQIVNSILYPRYYPPITVQQGIPVRWTINAPPGSINGCNYVFVVNEYGIEHVFAEGDNVIEFLPTRAGTFSYSCWMGMIRSSITVVAD